jgi:aspartyl-tRNA(Asn)/glutamyl-tRNA(Gln) amidotransferase subunit A
VNDAAVLLEVMAGADAYDSTVLDAGLASFSPDKNAFPRRVAYLKEPLDHPGLDPLIRKRTLEIIQEMESDDFQVDAVSFPYLNYLVPAYYVVATAEASSNLARYDGIHYGHRSREAGDLKTVYIKSRSEGFGTEVKRRIMTGTFVLSTGYYEAYYAKAQKARRLIHDKTREILGKYPFILLPTTPRPAFIKGSMGEDPVALYLEDIFTIHANLAGLPAISLPLGTHPNGMPFGTQLLASRLAEKDLLALSAYMMKKFHVLA